MADDDVVLTPQHLNELIIDGGTMKLIIFIIFFGYYCGSVAMAKESDCLNLFDKELNLFGMGSLSKPALGVTKKTSRNGDLITFFRGNEYFRQQVVYDKTRMKIVVKSPSVLTPTGDDEKSIHLTDDCQIEEIDLAIGGDASMVVDSNFCKLIKSAGKSSATPEKFYEKVKDWGKENQAYSCKAFVSSAQKYCIHYEFYEKRVDDSAQSEQEGNNIGTGNAK